MLFSDMHCNGKNVHPNFYPKYLRVTLNRSFTIDKHIENLQKEPLLTRYNLVHKLAGTNWASYASVLKVANGNIDLFPSRVYNLSMDE